MPIGRWAACHLGHADTVQLLLKAPGVDVNQASRNRETPLHGAVRMAGRKPAAYKQIIRMLLSAPGVDPNATTFYSDEIPAPPGIRHPEWASCRTHKASPLFLVAGHLEDALAAEVTAQLLGHSSTDPNLANADGMPPLAVAIANGKPKTVGALLKSAGIEPNLGISMVGSKQPRECAMCGAQSSEVQKLRICGGCLAVAYCCQEHQKKHWSAAHKFHCDKLKGWKEHREGRGQEEDKTSLQLAIRLGRLEVARQLLADERVAIGPEDLAMASIQGNLDMLDLLEAKVMDRGQL